MLEIAIRAAKEAGKVISRYFEMTGLAREMKDDKTFVTAADKESETAIINIIKSAYPEHGILAEEGGSENPDASIQWMIDPIDGTHNFVNGIPIFSISIAAAEAGSLSVGVVYNPITNSLYAAERGKGTTYNGNPVRVSGQKAEEGLVTFGPSREDRERVINLVGKSHDYFKSVRLLGSTALELGYISRGGTEGFACFGLNSWDYAAGALLVLESGGTITDFNGNPWVLEQNYFAASNGVSHEALLRLIQST